MLINLIFIYVVIVLSAVIHEYAHGLVAYQLGDTTAKDSGRLTINPIAHLDPIGTVLVPIFLMLLSGTFIGWAKPVPYNPYRLRDQRYGSLKVAIAGPASNLLIAIVLGGALRLITSGVISLSLSPQLIGFIATIVFINIFLALFNLIPMPPLDGSKVFADLFPSLARGLYQIGFLGIFIALLLAFYILSPLAQLIFRVITGLSF